MFSQPKATLASQLAARWKGRKFKKLLVSTGSSDENGAMLKWAHDTFGVKEFIVAGTPKMLSFDPKQLAKLAKLHCTIKICPVENAVLHAKFYWFIVDPENWTKV
jgi:hypothetical protein